MKRLTLHRTARILKALVKENRKPLQRLIRDLMSDGKFHYWEDEEILLLKSIQFYCLVHGFIQEGEDLIRFAGFDLLLALPESAIQVVVDLVEKGSEDFVLEAFNGIDGPTGLGRLSEAKSKLLLSAADKALQLGKNNIALCIYRVALLNEAYLDSEDSHPLIVAAQTGNNLLGQAYSEAFNEHYHFRFIRYEKEYLEKLVLLGNAHLVELALNCNANIHAPTSSTGQSLLDIAQNEETREVLLRYGAKTTNHEIYLLRQGILSIEKGEVNHEVMKEIFSVPKPLLKYSYHNTTHISTLPTTWDLVFTAAKYRSVDALTYMLPYLESNCTDDDLDKLLTALLGVDTMARAPQNQENANKIIDVLQLLVSHKIFFVDPWKMDDEDYRMTADFSSKVARILNLACYNPENDSEYPDEDLVKIAMLLWRIGNIYGTAEGARDMLLLGINHQKKFLLEACLGEFDYDFALLDTEKTSAVWNVVGNQLGKEEVTKNLLQYAIDNGADLNHQTVDGLTALHAAYQYGNSMDYSPVKLLLAAGADQGIKDRFGRKAKEVPKEKFVFLSGGFAWPK